MVLCVDSQNEDDGEPAVIRCLAFSASGARMAVGGDFGYRMFGLPGLEEIPSLNPRSEPDPVWAIALDAHGRAVATAGAAGLAPHTRVLFWEHRSGFPDGEVLVSGRITRIAPLNQTSLVMACEGGGCEPRIEVYRLPLGAPACPQPPAFTFATAEDTPLTVFAPSVFSTDCVVLFAAREGSDATGAGGAANLARRAKWYCQSFYSGAETQPAFRGVLGAAFLRGGAAAPTQTQSSPHHGFFSSVVSAISSAGALGRPRAAAADVVFAIAAHRRPLVSICGVAADASTRSHLVATASQLGTLVRIWDLEKRLRLSELRVGYSPAFVTEMRFRALSERGLHLAAAANREVHVWRLSLDAGDDAFSESCVVAPNRTSIVAAHIPRKNTRLGDLFRQALPFEVDAALSAAWFRFDPGAPPSPAHEAGCEIGEWVKLQPPVRAWDKSGVQFAFIHEDLEQSVCGAEANRMAVFATSFSRVESDNPRAECEWRLADLTPPRADGEEVSPEQSGTLSVNWRQQGSSAASAEERINAFCVSYINQSEDDAD